MCCQITKLNHARDLHVCADKDMHAPNITIVKIKEEVLGNLNIGNGFSSNLIKDSCLTFLSNCITKNSYDIIPQLW